MSRFSSFFAVIFFLSFQTAFSQQQKLNRITLSWDLFNRVNSVSAADSTGNIIVFAGYYIDQEYSYVINSTTKKVTAKFVVSVSLDSVASRLNEQKFNTLDAENKEILLRNAQGYIDIAVIYGRILKQKLESGNYSYPQFKTQIREVYDAVDKQVKAEQDKYMLETVNGTNAIEQQKWDVLISDQLLTGKR